MLIACGGRMRHDAAVLTDDTDPIRAVEIASARAWPAAETSGHAGWLLRATPGIDRARSNSALTPPAGRARTDDLDAVTAWYEARGIRPRIMVSPLDRHPHVDAELERRGWAVQWDVDLLVASLDDLVRGPAGATAVALWHAPTHPWLQAWAACEARTQDDVAAQARHVLGRLGSRALYALAGTPDAPTGVGIGVVDGSWCGIFAMATAPGARRQGVASAVLRALAQGARQRGAVAAYLQVTTTNAAAQTLYARHGFTRSHGYRTRVAPAPPSGSAPTSGLSRISSHVSQIPSANSGNPIAVRATPSAVTEPAR
ncbi:MAG: GCN5-related N-acetyltransferase [Solirubrobacterales bacterium]|nr:GCN5-related N-acetyltransferase [Solirubrobacterales bacterium]